VSSKNVSPRFSNSCRTFWTSASRSSKPRVISRRKAVELRADLRDGGGIVLEQLEPRVDGGRVALDEPQSDAERVEELQAEALGLIQRGEDVALELGKARRGERGLVTGHLRRQRLACRHDEQLRHDVEEGAEVVADKRPDRVHVVLRVEQVDLVDHHDDLLAPFADLREELALALGEGAVGGGDEQHQVGPRHEPARQQPVRAGDGVGAGGVDHVDVAQQGSGGPELADRARIRGRRLVRVPQQLHVGGRGGHPLLEDAFPEQRVDERALARVELADDDEQEEVVELLQRLPQRGVVVGLRVGARQRAEQLLQHAAHAADDLRLLRRQHAGGVAHGGSILSPLSPLRPASPGACRRRRGLLHEPFAARNPRAQGGRRPQGRRRDVDESPERTPREVHRPYVAPPHHRRHLVVGDTDDRIGPDDAAAHAGAVQEGHAAEHPALGHGAPSADELADAPSQRVVVGHEDAPSDLGRSGAEAAPDRRRRGGRARSEEARRPRPARVSAPTR